MPQENDAMLCPRCGVAMNHHAEKPVYVDEPEETGAIDPVLGAVVIEVHTCPECGESASRRAGEALTLQPPDAGG